MTNVRERLAQEYLIVSPEFASLFDEMEGTNAGDPETSSWDEDYEAFSSADCLYRPRLLSQARVEIESARSVFELWR